MTKIQIGQIYQNVDTGNTWRVTEASSPLIHLVHVETEDRALLSRAAIARFYILQSPADLDAPTAHANLRAQVAVEVEHAATLQPAPRYSIFDGDEIHRDGRPWLLIRGTGDSADQSLATARRLVDLLNQHGEGDVVVRIPDAAPGAQLRTDDASVSFDREC